jgi:hypothetical protein
MAKALCEDTVDGIVAPQGGERVRLPWGFIEIVPSWIRTTPIWTPRGNEIFFWGKANPREQLGWRIASLGARDSKLVSLHGWHGDREQIPYVLAWTHTNDGHEWIVYSAPTGYSRSLFRVTISPQ